MAINYYALPGIRRQSINIDGIINAVNAHFGFDCREKTRRRPYPEARMIAMNLARKNPLYTLKEIGRAFGVDHTTVMHNLSVLDDRMETNDWVCDHYWDIAERLKNPY